VHEWQRALLDFLSGVEANLCPSAPKSARTALARLRSDVRCGTKKATEQRVEALLQSRAYFRAAARRHINAKLEDLLPRVERVLQEWRRQLTAVAKSKGRSKRA